MSELAFIEFARKVREWWPTHRMTDEEMRAACWDRVLSKYPADVVGQALWQHKGDEPDKPRPTWKSVYAHLPKSNRRGGLDDLQALIRNMRLAEPKRHEHASDGEVWQTWVDIQARKWTHDGNGKLRPDPDGCNAKCAKQERFSQMHWARGVCREAEREIPEYLIT